MVCSTRLDCTRPPVPLPRTAVCIDRSKGSRWWWYTSIVSGEQEEVLDPPYDRSADCFWELPEPWENRWQWSTMNTASLAWEMMARRHLVHLYSTTVFRVRFNYKETLRSPFPLAQLLLFSLCDLHIKSAFLFSFCIAHSLRYVLYLREVSWNSMSPHPRSTFSSTTVFGLADNMMSGSSHTLRFISNSVSWLKDHACVLDIFLTVIILVPPILLDANMQCHLRHAKVK